MLLDRLRRAHAPRAEFVVLGSDVSTRVLKVAISAKYASSELDDVPLEYRNYFMRSRDPARALIRIVPELRERAGFLRLNLMSEHYEIGEDVDVAFLRNALIYFPRERQERIVQRVHKKLRPGGLFAVGLTETLHGTGLSVTHVGSSLYLKEAS